MGSRRMTLRAREASRFTVLQWNAGGLSASKLAELREIIVEEEVDILIIQEANITEDNIKFYQIRDFTMYGLFKKRKVASSILVAIRNKFTPSFEVVKEMNEHDLSEIAVVNIWIWKTQLRESFNAMSPNWGYKNRNQAGQTVEDFIDSNAMALMYNTKDPKTFIHNSGNSTNPDLTMVSTNIVDQCTKIVIGDPGSGHRITKLIFESITKLKRDVPRLMWNFKKAKEGKSLHRLERN
ncbi:hypothetical protein JTE90_028162 [Oedothorax gibbosus]|uniref:Endonuclease/exonuclease/phosphatase domain-containing protein n=1 Tax=Oedothorax gibbosus TaxID=931172 RepID=A0AAV6V8J5_9ARAC|nr:hypothetical protein JTE90_028162 [Oedothorax gibbosus]